MTQDEIRALFEYEPTAGMLRRKLGGRKPYPWRGAGKDVGGRRISLGYHATKEEAAAAYAAGAAKYAGEFARAD